MRATMNIPKAVREMLLKNPNIEIGLVMSMTTAQRYNSKRKFCHQMMERQLDVTTLKIVNMFQSLTISNFLVVNLNLSSGGEPRNI